MNTLSRRSVVVMAGVSALAYARLFAQSHEGHHGSDDSAVCTAGTPIPIIPVTSDIPFDLAYIDTMIPHHSSVIALSERAIGELKDGRLVEIAQAVLDTQPGEIEQLKSFRAEWYPDEPVEISDDRMMEMMMVTMAGSMDGCTPMDHASMMDTDSDMDHMVLMDSEAIVKAFENADNKDLSFIDLVVPHHQMAVRQSQVGLELAEHDELRALLDDVIAAQTAEIEELLAIREEIEG
ncbi:MAG: DUF305 domain-containing protein [Thermomicrobiales bacterium]|nr:DUF305 domain-containing protein [Thermomicrobiales bacterium]